MMISTKDWLAYINKLSLIDKTAAAKMQAYVQKHGFGDTQALIDYAYGIATKYGEGSAALAAEMYDVIAELSGRHVPPAEVAPTPEYDEVAKAVNGTAKYRNTELVSNAVGRLVKRTGVDTTMKNAIRDGAEWAWIPHGDTCAFCLTLASRGWQKASKAALKGGHAEHIHAHCDCTYAISFDGKPKYESYDPDKYLEMYENAEGSSSKDKINALRREKYQKNKDKINAQKRAAYAKKHGTQKKDKILSFEKANYLKNNEAGLLLKSDGSIIEFDGIEHHVIGDKNILQEMQGGRFTHNHLLDVTFSTTDIRNGIVQGNLKELRAVTSQGNIHILLDEGTTLEQRRKFAVAFEQAQMKANNVGNAKLKRGEISDKGKYVNQRLEAFLSEKSNEYGLTYRKVKLDNSNGSSIIKYEPNIRIPGNAGAMFKNSLVTLPDGTESRLTPHSKIEKVQIIAGKGRERQIDTVDILTGKYQDTAETPELWQKLKGIGYVDYDGESYKADIHWYRHPKTGDVEHRVKPDAAGNWFYED